VRIRDVALVNAVLFASLPLLSADAQNWKNWGGDLNNSRNAVHETIISATTVANLASQWTFFCFWCDT
jgi:hypothetical protein